MKKNLPINWSWVKLGDVCEFIYGKGLTKKKRNEEGEYPVYGSNGIVGHHNEFLTEGPCLIIGRKGAAGEVHYSNKNCWPIDTTYFIRKSERYSLKFLHHLLKNLRLHILDKSTAIPGLNRNDAYRLTIPLPPLPEQKKIVEKIEELFSDLEKGVASLKKAKEQIKLYRQSVLSAAFSGRLLQEVGSRQLAVGKEHLPYKQEVSKAAEPKVEYKNNELPDGWKWVKLGEVIVSIRYGTSKKCRYDKTGKPVLRIPNIINGYIDDGDLKFAEFTGDEIKELSLDESDILIIRSNGSLSIVGKSAIVSKKHKRFLFAGYLIRIRLKSTVYNATFLNLLLSSNQLRNQIEFKAKSTSGVNNINSKEIQDLNIPLPPLNQQTQIVEEIERRFSEADNLEKAIDESLTKAEALRQSILKQAFEGKLV